MLQIQGSTARSNISTFSAQIRNRSERLQVSVVQVLLY